MTLLTVTAYADDKIKFNVVSEELPKVIEIYSKASGQKFVVDATVRGKITLFNQTEIPLTEAFEQLSSALAINGYAISKQGDVMIVRNARSVQRDYIEVSTERPSLKPVRMYTWIYSPKYLPARELFRSSRIFDSVYGEVSVNDSANQIIFTDFTSSLNRVADLLKELDKKVDPTTEKLAMNSKKLLAEETEKKIKATKDEKPVEKTEK